MNPAENELRGIIKDYDDPDRIKQLFCKVFKDTERAEIHVNVPELYNPHSIYGAKKLDEGIFDYAESCTDNLPRNAQLRIILHNVPEEDQEAVPDLYREHYKAALRNKMKEKRRNRNKMISMIVIGLAFLSLYLYLAVSMENAVFLEVLSVIGSFALWEATNSFLIARRTIDEDLLLLLRYYFAEIGFE